jgi:hypothetical protein
MGASLITHINSDDNLSDLIAKVTRGSKCHQMVGNILYDIYDDHPNRGSIGKINFFLLQTSFLVLDHVYVCYMTSHPHKYQKLIYKIKLLLIVQISLSVVAFNLSQIL